MTSRRALLIMLAGSGLSVAGVARAGYLYGPVKIVVDRPAGSPHDLVARALADKLVQALHRAVVVEDHPGAGGNLAAEYVARAAPDGRTLLVALDTTLTVNPTLYKHLPFDAAADLRPLSILATASTMLVVHPSVPVHSVAEFVAYAKAHPITYAHGGNGSPGNLAMEYFRLQAGFPAIGVPYRGNPQVVMALLAGEVKFGFVGTAGVIEHVRGGRLRGLAISSLRRSLLAPDIPTIAEAGYPKFKSEVYYVLAAPDKIPENTAALLETKVREALESPDFAQRFRAHGIEIAAIGGTEAKARIESDRKLWAKVIAAAGMTVQ
jgi:tripartite-type tricarboxylate transporter receptor subunit TctC